MGHRSSNSINHPTPTLSSNKMASTSFICLLVLSCLVAQSTAFFGGYGLGGMGYGLNGLGLGMGYGMMGGGLGMGYPGLMGGLGMGYGMGLGKGMYKYGKYGRYY